MHLIKNRHLPRVANFSTYKSWCLFVLILFLIEKVFIIYISYKKKYILVKFIRPYEEAAAKTLDITHIKTLGCKETTEFEMTDDLRRVVKIFWRFLIFILTISFSFIFFKAKYVLLHQKRLRVYSC